MILCQIILPVKVVKVTCIESKCCLNVINNRGLSISQYNFDICSSDTEWYHGDAFGLDDEKMQKLMGFRCHECLKRAPPICPYGPTTKRLKSAEVRNDATFECLEEVLNVSPPSNEVNFGDDSLGKENSAASVPVYKVP